MLKKIILFIFPLALLFMLSSCNLFNSVSVEQRIVQFVADCNSADKSEMYKNLLPTISDYNARIAASTWTEFSDAHYPWSIDNVIKSGITTVEVNAKIHNSSLDIAGESIIMRFQEGELGVWYISYFDWPSHGSVNFPID